MLKHYTTKENDMKKLALLLVLTLMTTLLPFISRTAGNVDAADIYLRNPNDIAAVVDGEDTIVYVYDTADGYIKAYLLDEQSQSSSPSASTQTDFDLLDMKSDGTLVYALVILSGNKTLIKLEIDPAEETNILTTQLSSEVEIPDAIKFSFYENNFYILLSIGGVECMQLTSETLTRSDTILWSHLSPSLVGSTITDIEASENQLFLTEQKKLYSVELSTPDPYICQLFFTGTADLQAVSKSGQYIFACQYDKITQIQESDKSIVSEYQINTSQYGFTNATSLNDTLFFSDSINHQILLCDTLTSQTIVSISNYVLTPSLFSSDNIKIGKTTTSTILQILPYTTTDGQELQQDTSVIILSMDAEFENHYYCMISNSIQNRYGYIPKSVLTIVSKSTINEEMMTFAGSTKVYRYPSIVSDTTNTIITTLPSNTKLTRTCLLDYTNQNNNTFSEIKLSDGTIGYIENSRLAIPVEAKTALVKANAKLKTNTILYSDADGQDKLMELQAGTRVLIDQKLNQSQKYTRITFNLPTGEEVSGYVLTSSINPDSLSLMQILGIILVSINLVFLTLIILIRKRLSNI